MGLRSRTAGRNNPCKFPSSASPVIIGDAVAGGRSITLRDAKPVGEQDDPSAVPSNPNSRRGRKRSPLRQGRDRMDAIYIGIDVSKDRLDVHVRPGDEAFPVARNGAGIDELIARLGAHKPALIAVEATGGFETVVAAGLAGAGLPVAILHPPPGPGFAPPPGQTRQNPPTPAAGLRPFS